MSVIESDGILCMRAQCPNCGYIETIQPSDVDGMAESKMEDVDRAGYSRGYADAVRTFGSPNGGGGNVDDIREAAREQDMQAAVNTIVADTSDESENEQTG